MGELFRAVVAIPICNEAERVPACLRALGTQRGIDPDAFGIVAFVNGSTDGTAAVVRALAPELPSALRLIEDTVVRAPNAGWARRVATEAAATWLSCETSGRTPRVILTTDADSTVPPDWLARNVAAIDAGADAVAGTIALDSAEAALLPAALHARGALEGRYEALLIEIVSRLRPEAHDPWPRHWTDSGASLAVTLDAYRRIGGMPELPAGEDRAFVAALRNARLKVRHDPEIRVVTSGRLVGRAVGGAADTMRARATEPDTRCDERLEPVLRVLLSTLSGRPSIPGPLRPSELPFQIRLAEWLLGVLRLRDSVTRRAERRAGTRFPVLPDPGPSAPVLSASAPR